jgi:small neutral amino acid transporter SnatA (MarC family)
LNLRQEAVSIAGGIKLFLISLRIIFPTEKGIMGEMPARELFFFPLAVPLLAGPSTLAMLILLARSQPDRIFEWLIAVLGAGVVTSLIMLSSTKLHKLLGVRGLIAAERLMGMVLVAISVQMLLDGITTYLSVIPSLWFVRH